MASQLIRGTTSRLFNMFSTSSALQLPRTAGMLPLQSRSQRLISPVRALGGGAGDGGSGRSGVRHFSGGEGGEGGRRAGWGAASFAASVALQGALFTASAEAAKKKEAPASKELTVESVTNALVDVAGPVLTNLGFSGCMGVAAGVALKKIGQLLAFVVGLAFVALQGLAYTGFITVNWSNVHSTVNKSLDLNRDGKVDKDDLKFAVGKGLGVLAQGVPSVAGFLGGFVLGLRM